MGLETPNAGPIPYDVFIGRGWEEDIIWPLDDLSDVTDVRVGLSRQGVPASKYELALTEGHLLLDYCPLDGEAVGGEPPNALLIRLPPSANEAWVPGIYRFDVCLTRGDGAKPTRLEGLIEVRAPA